MPLAAASLSTNFPLKTASCWCCLVRRREESGADVGSHDVRRGNSVCALHEIHISFLVWASFICYDNGEDLRRIGHFLDWTVFPCLHVRAIHMYIALLKNTIISQNSASVPEHSVAIHLICWTYEIEGGSKEMITQTKLTKCPREC